jgi:dUTP pyrophosphatase
MPKKLKIKRFDKDLPLPEYKAKGAACFDCYVRVETTILPSSHALIPLNIAIKPPKNHFIMLVARSSFYKRGLIVPNGIGIGDEDFCGDNDEYHLPVLNLTNTLIKIDRGERIAQMLILPYEKMRLQEAHKLNSKNRGGFGTTGK